MPGGRPALAAVVVHYKGVDETVGCVENLPPDMPVIVVDNSADAGVLRARFGADERVTIVPQARNIGFGQAANAGATRADADALLLVNPDARPQAEDLERLLRRLEAGPEVAGVAPALVGEDGRLHNDGGGWLPTPLRALAQSLLAGRAASRGVWLRPHQPRLYEVEWLTTACAVLRTDAFRAVGGFAPEFVLYNEDMDLGRRLGERGYALLVDGTVRVRHERGGSSGGGPSAQVLRLRGESLGYYVRRHSSSRWASVSTRYAFALGFVLRGGVYLATRRPDRAREMLVYARGVVAGPRPVLS